MKEATKSSSNFAQLTKLLFIMAQIITHGELFSGNRFRHFIHVQSFLVCKLSENSCFIGSGKFHLLSENDSVNIFFHTRVNSIKSMSVDILIKLHHHAGSFYGFREDFFPLNINI